jgi:hypothetical protein
LSAFDLLDATLDGTKNKTSDHMDTRLRDHIVMWQYATECNSNQGGTFARAATGQHGQVDLNICSKISYNAMYFSKYSKFDELEDGFK